MQHILYESCGDPSPTSVHNKGECVGWSRTKGEGGSRATCVFTPHFLSGGQLS